MRGTRSRIFGSVLDVIAAIETYLTADSNHPKPLAPCTENGMQRWRGERCWVCLRCW
jgi:hypothetical protein